MQGTWRQQNLRVWRRIGRFGGIVKQKILNSEKQDGLGGLCGLRCCLLWRKAIGVLIPCPIESRLSSLTVVSTAEAHYGSSFPTGANSCRQQTLRDAAPF